MKAHADHARRAKAYPPCASWHITFGGKCLNCSYVPTAREEAKRQDIIADGLDCLTHPSIRR